MELTTFCPNETEQEFLARAKKFYHNNAPKKQLSTYQRSIIRNTLQQYLLRAAASGTAYMFTFNNKRRTVKCMLVSCSTGEIIHDTVTARCNKMDEFDLNAGMMICIWRIQGVLLPPFLSND